MEKYYRYSTNTSLFKKFKYWAIKKLAGSMPVVLNLVISRPKNYEGSLILFDGNKEGLISDNFLFSTEGEIQAIIEAVQDVDIDSRLKNSK